MPALRWVGTGRLQRFLQRLTSIFDPYMTSISPSSTMSDASEVSPASAKILSNIRWMR